MSFVTDQYVTRTKTVTESQYVSIKSTLERTLGPKDGPLVSEAS
jgi:hypothetical protein